MQWLSIGLRVIPFIFAAVTAVEKFVKGTGQEKQTAAVEMVAALLESAEGVSGKELLDDEAVKQAAKEAIDAIVALQNVIAKRKAA